MMFCSLYFVYTIVMGYTVSRVLYLTSVIQNVGMLYTLLSLFNVLLYTGSSVIQNTIIIILYTQ